MVFFQYSNNPYLGDSKRPFFLVGFQRGSGPWTCQWVEDVGENHRHASKVEPVEELRGPKFPYRIGWVNARAPDKTHHFFKGPNGGEVVWFFVGTSFFRRCFGPWPRPTTLVATFHPKIGENEPILTSLFEMSCFNHQLHTSLGPFYTPRSFDTLLVTLTNLMFVLDDWDDVCIALPKHHFSAAGVLSRVETLHPWN